MPQSIPHCLCDPFDNTSRPPSQSWSKAHHPVRRHRTLSSVHPIRARRGDASFQYLLQLQPRSAPTTSWAVEDTLLRVKHKPHRGYSGSSTLYLLTHLYKTYSVISNADWLANDKRFCEAYAPTFPIEVAWRHIDDAVAYANAGSTPYSNKQVVDNAYQLVFNTGIFAADCRLVPFLTICRENSRVEDELVGVVHDLLVLIGNRSGVGVRDPVINLSPGDLNRDGGLVGIAEALFVHNPVSVLDHGVCLV